MANNRIGVTLDFKANTSQAKQAMQQLQQSLAQISSKGTLDLQFQKAASAAKELSFHLNNAYNADTGKLNLGKLTNSLNTSKQNLNMLAKELLSTGEIGRQAFVSLSQSISLAEPAVFKLNGVVGKLWQSLKNVASWQISSGILQGLTSGLSEAYQFAQDLNESLNNIRIVTGYSKEEMDAFAKSANKAAKALSTTTTAMTDASLIYFQQGLNMQEAQKRAEITIKLANVTGEAVSTVSDQLTAVWNNFYDGSQTLEYYVDILTALGAATASSTDEITNGLEKFAAIAETVGLSYEYAASALATVTATTRQSADIVGTAFKTLFARIQDLELGKTLDDGTTLGQYSQALAAVGINIKDANGEVKDMNIILDEMGAKWNTLNKDTQIALAQNVAGVRQYTQLMALMDNWSFFQENLNTSLEATGELNKQHEIYAEGWEAAAERVTAALEDIYQDILDDDFFIDILNMIEEILGGVDSFIEKIGGIGPIISGIMGIIITGLSSKITPMVNNLILSFQTLTPQGAANAAKKQVQPLQDTIQEQIKSGNYSQSEIESLKNSSLMIEKRQQYFQISKNLTEEEKRQAELQFTKLEEMQSHNVLLVQNLEQLESKYNDIVTKLDDELEGQTNIVDSLALQKEYLEQNEERERRRNELIEERKKLLKMEKAEESYDKASAQMTTSQAKKTGFEEQLKIEQNKLNNARSRQKVAEQSGDGKERLKIEKEILAIREKMVKLTADITAEEAKQANLKADQERALSVINKGVNEGPKANDAESIRTAIEAQENKVYTENKALVKEQIEVANGSKQVSKVLEGLIQKYKTLAQQTVANAKTSKDFEAALNTLKASKINFNFKEILDGQSLSTEAQQIIQNILGIDASADEAKIEVQKLTVRLKELGITGPQIAKIEAELNKAAKAADKVEKEVKETNDALIKGRNDAKGFADSINPQHTVGALENIAKAAGGISSVTFSLQSLGATFKSLGDESLSGGEKITSVITSVTMAIPSLISGIKALATVLKLSFGWTAVIVAGVSILIGVIAHFWPEIEKEKTALEEATEAAKAQKEALEAITEAAKEMTTQLQETKDLIASYRDVADAFDGLIEGSDAYIENLEKEQELINSLLEKYPELINMGIIGLKDGRYQVLNEALLSQYTIGKSTVNADKMSLAQLQAAQSSALANNEQTYAESILEFAPYYDITKLTDAEKNQVSKWEKQRLKYNDINQFANDVVNSGSLYGDYGENYSNLFSNWLDTIINEEELEDVNNNHLATIEKINKQYEQKYDVLANQMLQSIKGFSDLNEFQQTAVSKELSAKMYAAMNGSKFSSEADEVFSKELGNYILKVTGANGEWNPDTKGSNKINDIGDFFANTAGGRQAASVYAQTVLDKDITFTKDSHEYDTIGAKDEDGNYIVKWAEAAGYYAANEAYETFNFDAAFERAARRSDATNAAINENLKYLSEEQLKQIANYNKKGQYEINTNSADIKVAAEVLGFQQGSDEYENWIANLNQQLLTYDANLAETVALQQDLAEGQAIISQAAEKYDLDPDVLANYADTLHDVGDEYGYSYEQASRLAVMNARLSKGLDTLRDNWEDISDNLKKYDKGSWEWTEAATEASKALEEVFGVSVSVDFIDKYQSKIQVLAEGGDAAVKVFEELETLASEDFIDNLDISDNYKAWFKDMLADLQAQEGDGITIGIHGEISQDYINSINQLLEEGALTADQVNAMFNSIGWDPNLTTKPGKPVTNTSYSRIESGGIDPITGEDLEGTTSWQRIVTTTDTEVPVIGDVTSAPKSTSSIKTNTTSGGSSKKQTRSKEKDRYHELKETLSDLEREYNRIADAKDRAWGPDKLAYIEQERAILEEELKTQEALVEAMRADVDKDFSALSKYGASRDSSGRLTNYDDMWNANLDLDDEAWDEFVNAISQYEETLNGFEEEEQKLLDMNNQKIDSYIEEIEYTVEHTVEKIDYLFTVLEHQIENLSDPIYDAAEAISKLGEQAEKTLEKVDAYRKGITDILAQSGFEETEVQNFLSGGELNLEGHQLTQAQVDALVKYQESLWDANDAIEEVGDSIHEKVVNAVEEMNSQFNNQANIIEHNNSLLKSYRNIIDLIGQDALGISDEVMASLSRASVQSAQKEMEIAKTKLDTNKAIYESTLAEYEALKDQLDGKEKERWEETIKSLKENLDSAESEFMNSWTNALQAAADAFDESVKQVVNTFKDAMAGLAGSNDVLTQRFEQQKEISERYLDDYQKIYELSKLNRDLGKSIDETDSVVAKSKLRDLQEEINSLQESNTEMTQYEVDELRARYELRLAEIALEDAQNAKSQVRMRRDSEGNWSYVYTADEEATSKAQQGYEDKLYAYQELTQNYVDEMESALIDIPSQMAEAIASIHKENYETEEEYLAAIEEVQSYYQEKYKYHLDEMNKALGDSSIVYQNDWASYSEKTGYKISKDKEWRDAFNETILAELTGYDSASTALSTFSDNSQTLLNGLKTAYSTWRTDVDGILDLAETDWDNLGKKIQEETEDIVDENNKAADSASNMADDFETAYDDILGAATKWAEDYKTKTKAIIDQNTLIAENIATILNAYQGAIDKANEAQKKFEEVNNQAKLGDNSNNNGQETYNYDTTTTTLDGRDSLGNSISQVISKDDIEKIYFDSETTNTGKVNLKSGSDVYINAREYQEIIDKLGLKNEVEQLTGTMQVTVSNNASTYTQNGKQYVNDITGKYKILANELFEDEIFKTFNKGKSTTTYLVPKDIVTQIGSGGGGAGGKPPVAIMKYDTGGYTGSWDSSGRLAMLHQKELVLNAADTENFLAAVNIVRDIASMIDLRAAAQQSALSTMAAVSATPVTQTLQQEITIHAEFPHATQRTEIEAAFDTLLNRASQFANRKK